MKKDEWLEEAHLEIKSKLKDIVKKAEKRNVRFVIPTLEERNQIREIIFDYIKKKDRVIYGGTAINMWIEKKDKNDAIYDKELPGDIEFYSPDPLKDIFVEHTPFCDISYMTESIMKNNIPTKKIKGIKYVTPRFLLNDMFRVFSNPLHDYPFRLEKVFSRYSLLKKHYFNPPEKPDKCDCNHLDENQEKLRNLVFDKYILDNKNVILCGVKAYLYYMEYSKHNIDFYHPKENYDIVLIVDDVKKETEEVLKVLKKYDKDLEIKEYTKFFQFYDRKLSILYKGSPVVSLMGYNKICTPFHTLQLDNKKNTFQIVSFDYLVQYLNARSFKEKDNCDHYYCMVCYLLITQDYYLKKNKLIGVEEDHLFSHFMIECKWITLSGIYVKNEQRKQRFKEKKGPAVYEYRPENKFIEKSPDKKYLNASGNQIIQKKRLLIKDEKYLPDNIK